MRAAHASEIRSRLVGRGLRFAVAGGLAAMVAALVLAPARRADAAFHLAEIGEAMFGINGDPNQQFVEIRLQTSGQNLVANTRLSAWTADGSFFGVLLLVPSNVSNSAANARWTMGTAAFAAASGIYPDFIFAPAALPSTGMICWGAPGLIPPNPASWDATNPLNYVDCVPYNGYAAANIRNGPASPFGLGDGTQSLTRVANVHNTSTDFVLACPSPQANTNAIGLNHDLHVGLRPAKAFDDLTWPNSDTIGDNCGDTDDDNDGLSDTAELAGPCASSSGPTDPLKGDTDGDLVLDGAECALGTDPTNPSSKPSATACGASTDPDGDGFSTRIEVCGYNTDPNNANTDGDSCGDGREIASVNGDFAVTSADLGSVAAAFGPSSNPNYHPDLDISKDGNITSSDLGLVASRFGACP